MLQVSSKTIKNDTQSHLDAQQAKIDALTSFEAKRSNASRLWNGKKSTKDGRAYFGG